MIVRGLPVRRGRAWALGAALIVLALQSPAWASKNYQLFRFDTTIFVPYGHGPGTYGGGVTLEPKFSILDPLWVGAHIGVGIFGGGSVGDGDSVSMNIGAVVPFLAKVEWYFLDSPIRPFVGFGMGVYDIASQSIGAGIGTAGGTAYVDQSAGVHFGMAPQVGIELGWFRLSVSYHALIGAATQVRQTIAVGGAESSFDVSQNYLSFEIGFRGWGKYRPAPPPPPPPPPPSPMPAPAAEPMPAPAAEPAPAAP
jgi:hypothetical protein